MRRLQPAPELQAEILRRLANETARIQASQEPVGTARQLYVNARRARWFRGITEALKAQSGAGERCMYCSGSESAQVEHYRPKAVFPLSTFLWENFLWTCGICNQYKSNSFPAEDDGGPIVNPRFDDVWRYFFLDEFANLTARWRQNLDDVDPQAKRTIELIKLDRQALQEARLARLRELRETVTDTLARYAAGELTAADVRARYNQWSVSPLHPDVADYFLNGPDEKETPFREFLEMLHALPEDQAVVPRAPAF
jgi:uncharacterized protein (TIGR02646 family)